MKNDLVISSLSRPPFGARGEPVVFAPGTTIAETMPEGIDDMLVVQLNGGPGYVSRKDWGYELKEGDVLEWFAYPRGDGKGGILQLLLVVVSIVANAYAPGSGAAVLAFGSFALQVFLAPDAKRQTDTSTESNTYSVSVQGNKPRLYQVIPKICGRHQTYPPFAGEPYTEFRPVLRNDGFGGTVEDHDQFFYAVYCIGIGNHDIERVLIDDTPIESFKDIITATYLPPGTLPTQAKPNIVTSPEVAGQELLTAYYVGGFAACGPRSIATHVSIDIVAPRGVYISDNSGNPQPLNLAWTVEVRYVNQFGVPQTTWTDLMKETRTNVNSLEPRRYTNTYELPTPGRVEIRIVRTDIKSNSGRASHDLTWSSLRAILQTDVTLNEHAAHFELVMRASKQLNNISQSRLSIIATAKCRTWHPTEGWSAEEVATRNPAWWLADLWTSPIWGEGLDDSRCDLQQLYEYSLLWANRQDRFDYVFDTAIDADSAAQIIAGAGRCRCFRRGGVRTLARDEKQTLPRTAFHRRNTIPGSMQTTELLPGTERPDGVIVEYFDNRSWSWGLPIECPAPGVESMSNPVRLRLYGITGRTHATREGLYNAAKLALRRQTVQCTTEMQGILPTFFEAVRWQDDTGVSGQCGDVIQKDDLTITLSEPVQFGEETLMISFQRDDGTYTTPAEIAPGATDHDVVLLTEPDFLLVTDDPDRERPKFMIFKMTQAQENLVKISLIEDGGEGEQGEQLLRLTAFVDDDRIHDVDVHLLPGPGDDQDPIDTTPGVPDVGTKAIVRLPTWYEDFVRPVGPWYETKVGWTFHPDGRLSQRMENLLYGGYDFTADFDNAWLVSAPLDVIHSNRFEVRATPTSIYVSPVDPNVTVSGPFNTWQPLNTEQEYFISVPATQGVPGDNGSGAMNIVFEIREIATGIIQASSGERNWSVTNIIVNDGGGA